MRKKEEEEEGEGEVPPSVKRYLLLAQRALREGDYSNAETACHRALELLATSEYAGLRVFIEARAVTLDKVVGVVHVCVCVCVRM